MPQEQANQKISLLILAHMASGKTHREAFDAVMGDGAWDKFAGELYDKLRAKAQK